MLVFITSLRHPRNCTSYKQVLLILENSLRSICNQNASDYEVIVVCNEIPSLQFSHAKIHYVKVDFPPPSDIQGSEIGIEAIRLDRGAKYLIGLLFAKRFSPTHSMFVDADDFVSNRIAGFVSEHRNDPGWYVSEGYIYSAGSNEIGILKRFNANCGSCYIVRYLLYTIPAETRLDMSREEIVNIAGEDYIYKFLGSHKFVLQNLAEKGVTLQPLPFMGAVYHVGHSQNWSGDRTFDEIPRIGLTRPVREEFYLPE